MKTSKEENDHASDSQKLAKGANDSQPDISQMEEEELARQFEDESFSLVVIDAAKIKSEVIRGDQTQIIF